MAWEIYTLGGGEYLYNIFQGVAALTQGRAYLQIIKLTALIAAIWILFESSLKNQFIPNVKWFIGFILAYSILMVPKTDIIIYDQLNRQKPYQSVSNVPLALGAFASVTSRAGHEMTKLFETAFLTSNNLEYHSHGLLFGSQLIEQASNLKIIDSEFSQNINGYIKQCVFYDILLNKYTLDELKQSKDIWGFITASPSKSRSFPYREGKSNLILTCQDGAKKLTSLWNKQIDRAETLFGLKIFPSASQSEAKAFLLSKLPISYNNLVGISKNAGDIIQQNMLINAIKSGSHDFAGHYLNTRADIQTRTAYQASKAQGSHWVPILRIMLEVLFYGAFPLVFLLILLPIGGTVATGYFGLFIWLQSWGPLYAILNMIMEMDTKAKSMAAAALVDGSRELTLMTKAGIAAINQDVSLAAGSWASMIPFISLILLYGAKSVTQLASATMAAPQAAANAAASEVATGNMSLANSSFGNASYDNLSANKWSDAAFHDGGRMQMTNSLGGSSSFSQAGKEVHDMSATVSKMPNMQVMKNDTEGMYFTQAANQSYQLSQGFGALADQSRASGYRKVGEFLDTHNINDSRSISYGQDVSADERQTLHKSMQEIQDFARQNNISSQTLFNLYATGGVEKSFNGSKNTESNQASSNMISKSNLSVPLSAGIETRANATSEIQYSEQEKIGKVNELHKDLNIVMNAVKSSRVELHDTHGRSLNESISQDFSTAERFEMQQRVNYEVAKQYSNQAQYASSSSTSFNADMTDDLINKMAGQRNTHGQPIGKLGAMKQLLAEDTATRENAIKYVQGVGINNYQQAFNKQSNDINPDSIQESYIAQAANLKQKNNIEYNSQESKEKFAKETVGQAIKNEKLIESVNSRREYAYSKINSTQIDKAGIEEEVREKLEDGAFMTRIKSLNPFATDEKKTNFNEEKKDGE